MIEHLPLKKSEVEATVKLPHAHLGQGLALLRKHGDVRNEQYDNYGISCEVGIVPGGM
jgi:hypothetical protein